MAVFQGIFFLLLGAGLLAADYRSLTTGGPLPCGPNGFKGRLEFHQNTQPLRYWLMFVGYGVAGIWMIVFAIRLLAGDVDPLPLR